ncbi:Got1/Sft2-like family-domain-containing protein [Circinella umbellata]|nr:Got1/Sft2-like family-domain-containing protein [Circinella umbellata]
MAFGFFSAVYDDQGTMDDVSLWACLYRFCIGNLLSILSLTFIVGIPKLLKTMFAPVRFWATTIYLVLLVLTLILSIWLKLFVLSFVMVIVQFCAMVWYAASYIPYGRELIRRFFGSCITSI